MESLKVLRRRTKSVQSTRHVTHAMEMVSATKLRRTEALLHSGRLYMEKTEALLERLILDPKVALHPFVRRQDNGKVLYVVFSSDRGFCGPFNNNIISFASDCLKEAADAGKEISLYWVGKKGQKVTGPSFPKHSVVGELYELNGTITLDKSNELASYLVQSYLEQKFEEIHLIYYRSISAGRNKPFRYQLFPFTISNERKVVANDYLFGPDLQTVLDHLFPQYIESKLYTVFIEQFCCEHKARMLAMHTATKNCKELIDELVLLANKARQAAITKDLLDIVGGAEALH